MDMDPHVNVVFVSIRKILQVLSGQVGTSTHVHYSEVVFYWGVSAKNHILSHTKQNTIHYHSDS